MYPENVKHSTNVPGYLNMTAGVARLAGGVGGGCVAPDVRIHIQCDHAH